MCEGDRWENYSGGRRIMQRWKEYYEQLLNEEFDWNKDGIGSIGEMNKVEASVDEREISVAEVSSAISKAMSGKAAGPSGVAADMLKAAGESGVKWVTDICNEVELWCSTGRLETKLDGKCV